MAEKTYTYEMVKELMVIGDATKRHQTVEIGHWIVNGEQKADHVYIYDYYFNKDGELVKGRTSVGSMSIDIYKALTGKEA